MMKFNDEETVTRILWAPIKGRVRTVTKSIHERGGYMNSNNQNDKESDSFAVMKLMPRQQQSFTFTPDVRLKLRMLAVLMDKPMNRLLEDLIDAMWDIHQNDKTDIKLSRKKRKRIRNIITGQ